MKKGNLIVILFVLFVCLQFVNAMDTKITIKTFSENNVDISVLEPDSVYSLLESFHVNSGIEGEVFVTFSGDQAVFDVKVWVKKGNEVIVQKRFEDLDAGFDVVLDIYPAGFEPEPEVNDTKVNETEEIIEVNETNDSVEGIGEEGIGAEQGAGITGLATSNDEEGSSIFSGKILYFIIGIILLIGAFFMGVLASKKRSTGENSPPKEIKIRKLSESRLDKRDKLDDYRKAVEDAESKILEAQKEIKKLKNQDKISDLKKKIIEDQKELMKLRGGND